MIKLNEMKYIAGNVPYLPSDIQKNVEKSRFRMSSTRSVVLVVSGIERCGGEIKNSFLPVYFFVSDIVSSGQQN